MPKEKTFVLRQIEVWYVLLFSYCTAVQPMTPSYVLIEWCAKTAAVVSKSDPTSTRKTIRVVCASLHGNLSAINGQITREIGRPLLVASITCPLLASEEERETVKVFSYILHKIGSAS